MKLKLSRTNHQLRKLPSNSIKIMNKKQEGTKHNRIV